MRGIGDYTVVYDISSDKERAKVERMLKGFGFRVQKSVFECRLDRKGKRELIEKLSKLELKTGFIKVYRLEYSSKQIVIGKIKKPSIDNGYAFII